jgi:acyl-CoA synthetase (AMP-forming)/AMP-acid ligase II
MILPSATSIPGVLEHWRNIAPDRRAFVFLDNDGEQIAQYTFASLQRRSQSIAALLQRHVASGGRAILMYPPGPDFIAAFLGCLSAGVIAVPVRPPHPARPVQTLSRLPGIVKDAGPEAVLATTKLIELRSVLSKEMPVLESCTWLATDSVDPSVASEWRALAPQPDALALLQYTSGSTDSPKGVMVSHANLLGNLRAIHHCEENDATSISLSWLPHYHDMGLVEALLQPLFGGYPCYQMAPIAFLRRPITWLESISRYRATNSGAPNFAYDLCVEKTSPEQHERLDLSCWRVAYNGSEPVRARTLRAFYRTFRDCGFRWRATYPVYGLAEATLVVSSGRQSTAPKFLDVDARALGSDQLVSPQNSERNVVTLTSCGKLAPGTEVAIVQPETHDRCAAGTVGEIWVRGPGVARGYWGNSKLTEQTFGARIARSGQEQFLRTGDLGLLVDGELFVTGRLKDVIIIRGRKHYAQDIESSVERCHPAIRSFGCASFAIYSQHAEQLAIVAELQRRPFGKRASAKEIGRSPKDSQTDRVIDSIRQTVAERHEIEVFSITLVSPGAIPRTTSGKLRRRSCREFFTDGKLESIDQWTRPTVTLEAGGQPL